MSRLVPAAYEVDGLVMAVVITNMVLASAFLIANELMAAGKAKSLALVETVAAPLRIAAATSAAAIGAFARPVSEAVAALATWAGFLILYRKWYRAPDPQIGVPAGSRTATDQPDSRNPAETDISARS